MRFSINAKILFSLAGLLCWVPALGAGPATNPQRIVTLIPSLGELAAEILESTDRIVGVSEYTDYPESLKSKPVVGPYHKANLEAVVGLKPDLVLASEDGNAKDQVERLRELRIPVLVVKTSTFKDVTDSFVSVGRVLGKAARGNELAKTFRKRLSEIEARGKKRKPVTVLFQIGDEPLVVAGKGTFLTEALDVVGAKNVYADSRDPYPRVAYEDAVKRNPERILILEMNAEKEAFAKMIRQWERFPNLQAVKAKQVRSFRADELMRPGSRLLDGVEILEKVLYGKE